MKLNRMLTTTEATFGPSGAGVVALLLTLLSLAPVGLGQEIKKKTQLILSNDQLAFEVAETKKNAGRGNSAATAILTGVALGLTAYGGGPVPDLPDPVDHSDDPNWDPNTDDTTPLNLDPGMSCRTRAMDKATVVKADGERILVEVSRDHYIYPGPQTGPAVTATVSDEGLEFAPVDNAPECLNKTKLWIGRDVFLALQAVAPPEVKKAVKAKK
jgi:hypothetical protein